MVFPYVDGLVKNAPDKDKAKKVLDFCCPTRARRSGPTPICARRARRRCRPQCRSRFLPDKDYARAKSVDWGEISGAEGLLDRYLAEVPMKHHGAPARASDAAISFACELSSDLCVAALRSACCRSPSWSRRSSAADGRGW